MAASSQYHRGVTAPSSHYHSLPNSHEHLYANLATTWTTQASHGLSRTPPSSALLQRFSSPGPYQLDYHDYVNGSASQQQQQQQQQEHQQEQQQQQQHQQEQQQEHHHHQQQQQDQQRQEHQHQRQQHQHQHQHQHQQQSPPQQQHHHHQHHQQHHSGASSWVSAWGETANEGAFPPRALTFGREARAPHPHPNNATANPNTSSGLLPVQDPLPPVRNAPQFPLSPPSQQQQQPPPSAAPVAHMLNLPSADLHVSHPHALSSDVVLASQADLGGSTWAMLTSADATNGTPPVYEHMPAIEPSWSVDAHADHLAYVQHPQSLAHVHHLAHAHEYAHHAPVASRGGRARRPAPKKSVARVPAAFVERQEKNKISKRQGPLSEASRQKTHQMRKDKTTCLRCRFYKSGCDCGDPCQKCLKTEGNARSFKLPCIRERLEDATLVRHCNGRSNQEEGEFLAYEWLQNCQLYDMEIIWNLPGFGPVSTSQPMRITFRQYAPQRPFLDTTTNMWSTTDGQIKVVEQPPYAVYDTASLIPIFERYFSHLQPAIEAWIFDRVQHDDIALLTYNEVARLRRAQPPGQLSLLDLVMRIQCLSVVSQGYGTVWSNNIPGIQTVDFASLGRSFYEAYDRNSRDRPLPGAINHQMDVAALKYLKKLERQCVKELSAMMFKSKIKPWYELFLALYVLFWNMEYIHRGANKYIMSKNGTAVQTHVSSVVSTQIKKWDWAFQVLLHHWIAVLRGYMPFKLVRENPNELREKGHLDPEGYEYVRKVANIFDQIGFGQSTSPFVGQPETHNSLSSEWIKTLFREAGA